MKAICLNIVMVLTLLLMVGCNDRDDCGDSEIFFQETNVELIDPDDYANAMLDKYEADFFGDKDWGQYEGIFNSLVKMAEDAITMSKSKEFSKLDKQFEAEAGLAGQTSHCWQIESHRFNYPSKSARGEDVILSGRIIFPNHKTKGIGHQLKSLMIYMHGAPQKGKGSSERNEFYTLRTFFDEAIIEPDGQGLGANLDKDYYCAIAPNVLVRQMADCIQAALEIMQRQGVTLADDSRRICVGKSLGGAVSLAFAKYYETEASPAFREKLKLSAVYEAVGPVDFEATIRHFGDHPEYNAMLSKTLLFSLAALSPEQLYGYQPQDFINENLLNTQVEYEGRTMSFYEAGARYFVNVMGFEIGMPNPKKFSEIIASDMLGRDGKLNGNNPKTQALMRVLAEQGNLSGWQPTIPIYITHCTEDDGIPVEQARLCYNKLSNSGGNPNVHYKEFSSPHCPIGEVAWRLSRARVRVGLF